VRNPHPDGRADWYLDPLTWAELFALSNIAFLAADIGLAHAVNAFANPAEYIPVAFSLIAPIVLVIAMAIGGIRPALADEATGRRRFARGLGLAIGWGSIAVGIAGVLFHLDSAFFDQQTLKNLVYTAPFAAPLAYAGLGLLLLLDRMVDSRSLDWSRWVVLLALGGFAGNFVLTLADHAQNGFFRPTEWIGVIASAFAVSSLCAVMVVPTNRPLIVLTAVVMAAQVAVGTLGFLLHILADLRAPAGPLWDRILYGAPIFAPLLFADLAMLAAIALWSVAKSQPKQVSL
jgi:hypothetical protein